MTAMKIFRDLLPAALHRDAPRTKRRKTQSLSCSSMDVDGEDLHQPLQDNSNKNLSTAPTLLISRSLAHHGLPDRLDPLSMDYLMDFDYHDGNLHYDLPAHVLMAIQHGHVHHLLQYYKSGDELVAQRNSRGETLLHLACRWGSVASIKSLLCDFKSSVFVLDKEGRTPLHTVCLVLNSNSLVETTNTRTCNHLESLRLLLQEKATLILYKDKHGKVPLEYIQEGNSARSNNVLLLKIVNETLCSEQVVERVVKEMSYQMEMSQSGRKMSTWEKIDRMLDFSGLDAAIMETGLSI